MAFSPLPQLSTSSDSQTSINYQSGARYNGHVEEHEKKGEGRFTWPDGSSYVGEYLNDMRSGKGEHTWADGSIYSGGFERDLRQGYGVQTMSEGSKYEGMFFRDRRHGPGTYTFIDGSVFTGTFYIDRREGYGSLQLINGDRFEGLYHSDERIGPGVLTHADSTEQDVGLWEGECLVKLISPVSKSVNMREYTDHNIDAAEGDVIVNIGEKERNRTDIVRPILEPPLCLSYSKDPASLREVAERRIFRDTLDPDSLAMNKEVFETEFFKGVDGYGKQFSVSAWSRSANVMAMQRLAHRHAAGEQAVGFNIRGMISGDRTSLQAPGPLERSSIRMLKAAGEGELMTVREILMEGKVSPEVSDSLGFTSLVAAVVGCHCFTIHCLLDFGADVSRQDDHGLTALSYAFMLYYPAKSFKPNIAESEYVLPTGNSHSSTNLAAPTFDAHSAPTSTENRAAGVAATSGTKEFTANSVSPGSPTKHRGDSGIDSRKSGGLLATVEEGAEVSAGGYNTQESTSGAENQDGVSLSSPPKRQPVPEVAEMEEEAEDDFELSSDEEEEDDEARLSVLSGDLDELLGPPREDGHKDDRAYTHAESSNAHGSMSTASSAVETIKPPRSRLAKSGGSAGISLFGGAGQSLQESDSVRACRWQVVELLLNRGADPNASSLPLPPLIFAIKAADSETTKLLLLKGASANQCLPAKKRGLSPLHIAAATLGEAGVTISQYVLDALADPDVRATPDASFLIPVAEDLWRPEDMTDRQKEISGGKTPLHIACARDDSHKNAAQVVHDLLDHHADPNVLCNGHSPLTLAICSGNDLAIDELLRYGADPNLALTHGNGNALCVVALTAYEHRRTPDQRIQLIDKLVASGADVLASVPIGPRKLIGTPLDYAFYIFNLDRRIAHMPYHALTFSERETYNARRKFLAHIGDIVREECIRREKERIQQEEQEGQSSRNPSGKFSFNRIQQVRGEGKVTFESSQQPGTESALQVRKPLFRYCYNCGRSVFVRLTPCTRCKEVYFCSKACKGRSWNTRHKDECIRIQEVKNPKGSKKDELTREIARMAARDRSPQAYRSSNGKGANKGTLGSLKSRSAGHLPGRAPGKDIGIGVDARIPPLNNKLQNLPPGSVRLQGGSVVSPDDEGFVDNYSFE